MGVGGCTGGVIQTYIAWMGPLQRMCCNTSLLFGLQVMCTALEREHELSRVGIIALFVLHRLTQMCRLASCFQCFTLQHAQTHDEALWVEIRTPHKYFVRLIASRCRLIGVGRSN